MRDVALDTNHDLLVTGIDLMLVDGAEQVRQQLLIKLKLWRGEWFLDTEFGTPYLQQILGKQLTMSGAIVALRKSILEVQGEGVWLDMEGTFSWGKPQITVRAMRYRFPGVHRVLTALVGSDRSTVWVMVSPTQLLTVDCADQTLYYRDGQLVDRYIVQENPDGTFNYAYGTDQEYGIDYKKG